MTSLTNTIFSHIVLTAPTDDIAKVYQVQLAILQDSVPFLQGTQLNCVSDPTGQRVGSGGGTLNGLAFIRKTYNIDVFDSNRVLVIHSGGESRRAPLYSLCGKAWTTINATVSGGEIASPIMLLIKELSLLCANLQPGSLVIASSDVMLDITDDRSNLNIFAQDAVTLVVVPEKPEVAKNHGVVIASKTSSFATDYTEGDVVVGPALNYLQKPTVAEMEAQGALYNMASFISGAASSTDEEEVPFALVDTGVVIFTGTALSGLVELLQDPVISGCIAKNFQSENNDTERPTIKLELYTDFLLALKLLDQQDFDLSVYLSRLGVQPVSNPTEASTYERALPLVWETLKNIPLQLLFIPWGKFEHLGTTAEVLQLLTQSVSTEVVRAPQHTRDAAAKDTHSPKLEKLQQLSKKYCLQPVVCSRVDPSLRGGVVINSVVSLQQASEHTENESVTETLIEHSLLSNLHSLPSNAVVSHLCAPIGMDLAVQNGIMLQQIYLRCQGSGISPDPTLVPFTLLVLGIRDDMKTSYLHPESTVCGATWPMLFKVTGVDPSSIWSMDTPAAERCLWNARLFCDSSLDHSGAIHVHSEGSLLPTTRLTLTWLQNLPSLETEMPAEHALAVKQWVSARRLSLADILTRGDATRMMLWRLWLQTAHSMNYGAAGRISAVRGDQQMTMDLSLTFQYLLEFGQSLGGSERDAESGHTVLLSRWLVQLVQRSPDAAFQRFYAQVQGLSNPSMNHIISSYLKKLVLSDSSIGAVLWSLFNAVPRVSASMHSRVLFLAAWVVKDRQFRANADQFLAISHSLSGQSVATTTAPNSAKTSPSVSAGIFESQLKSRGEDLLRAAGAAALSSVSQAERQVEGEEVLSLALERIAQSLVAFHLQSSLDGHQTGQLETSHVAAVFAPKWGVSVKSQAPARIDLAGGWSDTPPICYELSGAVLNVGVLVDDIHPIRCFSNMIKKPVLELHSQSLVGSEYSIERFSSDESSDFEDLACSEDNKSCLLLRAVLVALGVIGTVNGRNGVSLRTHLQSKLGGGISVTCVSDLPAGSGMGGSSILAATALHSLSALLGLPASQEALVNLVSQVEQILTTGGGWQDQVGGIYGGFKLCQSAARLPLTVSVEKLVTSHSFNEAIHRRLWLVYTGQQRLARNTLINALRYSALSPVVIPGEETAACPGTVPALVEGAHRGWSLLQNSVSEATEESADDQVDQLSLVLNSYWELKKEMAAGSEPPQIALLLAQLRPLCSGLSLCGAGAGGYAAVILKRDVDVLVLREFVDSLNLFNRQDVVECDQLSVHSVTVDWIGIQSEEMAIPKS